nr:hypothetical protein A6C57_23395 [Fibrella sp. ES10-3-2-2]
MAGRKEFRLPRKQVQYFVGEPVVVVPLIKIELTYELLMLWGRRDLIGENNRRQLEADLKSLQQEYRAEVKKAREYYRIQSARPAKPATDDSL